MDHYLFDLNKPFIDMHMHSSSSDGTYSPVELADLIAEAKISVAALTDHDSVGGVAQFLEEAEKKSSFTAIPGVEISSSMFNKELHILGLFIDHKNRKLLDFLAEQRKERLERNLQIIEKLSSLGYDISSDEVLSEVCDGSVGRPHIATHMVKKGIFSNNQQVFDELLKRGKSAYVKRKLPSPDKVIRIIHQAGGIAIWAHPVYTPRRGERHMVRKFLKRLVAFKLDGIETFYTSYNPHQHRMLRELAHAENLLESGGSDFHGVNQPQIAIGRGFGNLTVPFELYEKMLERIN